MTSNPHPASWRSTQIAPFVYPLFPGPAGTLRFTINIRQFFQYDHVRGYDGSLSIRAVRWAGGRELDRREQRIPVRGGRPDPGDVIMRWDGDPNEPGYVDVEIEADTAVFHRPLYEIGYGLICRPGYGAITVIESPKFADPRVIEQVREIGRYCVTHTMVRSDPARDDATFFYLVNPYDKALSLELRCPGSGRSRRVFVPAHSAKIEALEPLLGGRGWDTIMLTAKQRVIVYCVCAPRGAPERPNSIDHLDPFRGERTYQPLDAAAFAKHTLRQILGAVGGSR